MVPQRGSVTRFIRSDGPTPQATETRRALRFVSYPQENRRSGFTENPIPRSMGATKTPLLGPFLECDARGVRHQLQIESGRAEGAHVCDPCNL